MAEKNFTIEDKNLIDSLLFMRQNNLLKENSSKINFDSVKEAEESVLEDITSAVKEYLNNLKQDISYLQKKGYNLKLEGIRILEVPLKLKVWQSNNSRKDLENIFEIIKPVESLVSKMKKEQEKKEQEIETIKEN